MEAAALIPLLIGVFVIVLAVAGSGRLRKNRKDGGGDGGPVHGGDGGGDCGSDGGGGGGCD